MRWEIAESKERLCIGQVWLGRVWKRAVAELRDGLAEDVVFLALAVECVELSSKKVMAASTIAITEGTVFGQ